MTVRWREKSSFYSKRADQRMNALATKYPQHPRAASAGIYQGQRREDEGDYQGARDFYAKISPDSSSYVEAQFRLDEHDKTNKPVNTARAWH